MPVTPVSGARIAAVGVLLVCLLAACRDPGPSRVELAEVAHPDVSRLDPAVRRQLKQAKSELEGGAS